MKIATIVKTQIAHRNHIMVHLPPFECHQQEETMLDFGYVIVQSPFSNRNQRRARLQYISNKNHWVFLMMAYIWYVCIFVNVLRLTPASSDSPCKSNTTQLAVDETFIRLKCWIELQFLMLCERKKNQYHSRLTSIFLFRHFKNAPVYQVRQWKCASVSVLVYTLTPHTLLLP